MASDSATAVVNHDGQYLSRTSSRCMTESVTATHDFELIDYRLLDGMGVGQFVCSSTFTAGGYGWCIKFFPDGYKDDYAGHASTFLYCPNPAKEVRTRFTLNMLVREGKVNVTRFGLAKSTFSPPTAVSWGYPKFVEKSKLQALLDHHHSGSFIIRCVLTVIRESRTEVKRSLTTVPQPNLQRDLEQMRKDGEGADVTFSVSGKLFNAHRYILAARSPVFKAELFGPMKEKTTRCITINDIEPPIFDALLHFIYTDSIPKDDEFCREGKVAKLQHLLVAADRCGLERLRVMCEGELCENISVENVAITLVLAEQHQCRDLREACIGFMASRDVIGAVLTTDGFQHLMASCPALMKEILDKVSTRFA